MHLIKSSPGKLAAILAVLVVSPWAIQLFEPTLPSQLTPSLLVVSLWVFPLILYKAIRQPLSKVICMIWIAWFLIGMINIAASYLKYGDYYLMDATYPAFIYICYTALYFAGIVFYERLFMATTAKTREYRHESLAPQVASSGGAAAAHPVVIAMLLFFPVALFLSVYLSVGFIPILLGRNIEAEMYNSSYGYLYGFAAVIVLSMLYASRKYMESKGKTEKSVYLVLLICMGFVSIMTGKRMSLMVFFAALLAQMVLVAGPRSFDLRRIAKIALLVVGVYIGGQLLRAGGDSRFETASERFATVGVEYRDFAYAVTNFSEQMLAGYSWLSSTFASAINSSLLQAVGVDKQQLIRLDFGSITKPLFMGGDFGVRTGLVSELFFAYGFFGLAVIFVFGVLTGILNRKIMLSKDKTAAMFLCAIYGLVALVLTENSIDVSGTLTVYLYVWIVFVVTAKLLRKRRSALGQVRR